MSRCSMSRSSYSISLHIYESISCLVSNPFHDVSSPAYVFFVFLVMFDACQLLHLIYCFINFLLLSNSLVVRSTILIFSWCFSPSIRYFCIFSYVMLLFYLFCCCPIHHLWCLLSDPLLRLLFLYLLQRAYVVVHGIITILLLPFSLL